MSLFNLLILSAATIQLIHMFSSASSAFFAANILHPHFWRSCNPGLTLWASVTEGSVTTTTTTIASTACRSRWCGACCWFIGWHYWSHNSVWYTQQRFSWGKLWPPLWSLADNLHRMRGLGSSYLRTSWVTLDHQMQVTMTSKMRPCGI